MGLIERESIWGRNYLERPREGAPAYIEAANDAVKLFVPQAWLALSHVKRQFVMTLKLTR